MGVKRGVFIRMFVCILIPTICDTTDSISTYYDYSFFKIRSFISYTLVDPPPNLWRSNVEEAKFARNLRTL